MPLFEMYFNGVTFHTEPGPFARGAARGARPDRGGANRPGARHHRRRAVEAAAEELGAAPHQAGRRARMTRFPTVRVAAVQATPVILDAEATIDKAIGLLGEAAAAGAPLVVLPECFVSLYPSGAWAARRRLVRRLRRAVGADVGVERRRRRPARRPPGRGLRRARRPLRHRRQRARGRAARARSTTRCSTLGPEGVLHRHRKLMPTHARAGLPRRRRRRRPRRGRRRRRGRVGGLICWENRMPLARWRVYRGGPQIWLAPTADDSDGWLASMRHIAIEAGAFVVSASRSSSRRARFPPTSRSRCPRATSSAAAARDRRADGGELIAGPLTTRRDRHRRLRPPRGPARQALLRRRRPLRPRGRPGPLAARRARVVNSRGPASRFRHHPGRVEDATPGSPS